MDSLDIELPTRNEPLLIPWPVPGNMGGFIQFERADQWHMFVRSFDIDCRVPDPIRLKYARAQKLYLLGWIDADLIKVGELIALSALELATRDCYGQRLQESLEKKRARKPSKPVKANKPLEIKFADLLEYMVIGDGLTDAQMPMVARYGGSVVGQLTGATKPTLAQRRNAMAHGDPFDNSVVGGLLELVHDLIVFAYRRTLT
ncbi:hypothetical protein [Burkholderia sp. L27(2015)]|uniref:hypothetical protein n=1 Tax=Burkholderia sp. L27(2015) TaxID=1641858 RepID=UPI00131C6A82|nr:hypothetical protein [Burkholderia sp. L27(2015)]